MVHLVALQAKELCLVKMYLIVAIGRTDAIPLHNVHVRMRTKIGRVVLFTNILPIRYRRFTVHIFRVNILNSSYILNHNVAFEV